MEKTKKSGKTPADRKQLVQELQQAIRRDFGKRCPDYEPDCALCQMWHAFDTIKKGLDLL